MMSDMKDAAAIAAKPAKPTPAQARFLAWLRDHAPDRLGGPHPVGGGGNWFISGGRRDGAPPTIPRAMCDAIWNAGWIERYKEQYPSGYFRLTEAGLKAVEGVASAPYVDVRFRNLEAKRKAEAAKYDARRAVYDGIDKARGDVIGIAKMVFRQQATFEDLEGAVRRLEAAETKLAEWKAREKAERTGS